MVTIRIDNTVVAFPLNSTDYRDAVERAKRERAISRKKSIDALTSPQNDAQRRISLWEHLHGLRLPKLFDYRPEHPLVALIAEKTGLTVAQVRLEQSRRRSRNDLPTGL